MDDPGIALEAAFAGLLELIKIRNNTPDKEFMDDAQLVTLFVPSENELHTVMRIRELLDQMYGT